ncbi:MAG: hypothetical protein FJY43_08705 [Betaproteobacteria bacterium]|nr:hypothetical protein [Betaproteobacteria bacterium]
MRSSAGLRRAARRAAGVRAKFPAPSPRGPPRRRRLDLRAAGLGEAAVCGRAGPRRPLREGRDIELEWRYAEGDATRLPALAQELARLEPELIVASFNPSIAAAQRATRVIPIVMVNAVSPVEQGYVASLGRPGGNITGTAWSSPETMGKILSLLKEAAPRAARVALLGNPGFPGAGEYMAAMRQAGNTLGIKLEYFEAVRPEDIRPALQRIAAAKPDALYVSFDTVLLAGLREIAEFCLARKLVSMSNAQTFVDAGGLVYYGPDLDELVERTVSFISRILRGSKPADLPVELPARYRLMLNRRTAAAIGHRLPAQVLLRADQVIE